MTEKRRARRRRVVGDVRLHWNDDVGNFFNVGGLWCDLSLNGGGIHLRRPIRPGTTVKLESPWLRQAGMAVVRNCESVGAGFRLSFEFVAGTTGQPVDGGAGKPVPADNFAGTCEQCRTPFGPHDQTCRLCGQPRADKQVCALCGSNGARGEVSESVSNGFDERHPFQRSWPVHGPCLEKLRKEVRESFTVLRCPVCCTELDLHPLVSGPPRRLDSCPRCGIPPEAIEAGWLKRADACALCSLPVYGIIHAVWPGVGEASRPGSGLVLARSAHKLCAASLKQATA